MEKDIRWIQRFDNYKKAYSNLKNAVDLSKTRDLSDLEKQGLIQSFEFTYELAWKTLKDYLNYMQVEAKFPQEVMKQSFSYELIADGDIWMDMLEKRNLMAHTYDEETFQLAYDLITNKYFAQLNLLLEMFEKKINDTE